MVKETSQAPVVIYDTMTGTKRPVELLEPGRAGVYCCGPTVYDMSHIGHARAAVMPDLLVRYLRYRGVEVRFVKNFTDVDDKIIARAGAQGVSPDEISERYLEAYCEDMARLNVVAPDVAPKVTEHIQEIVDMVVALESAGYAYAVDGDVYYRVGRFGPYGALSKRSLEDMKAGARVEVNERKESPMDFALWKSAKEGEVSWESPWGRGRPGWHIECSAMSCKHLGETFDIHTGGRDLIFPHHENEIAQSQGVHGEGSFARYWTHNGFVNFEGEKMSKSLGNFFTIRDVMRLYAPEVIRSFLLGVHYRSPINFDVEVLCPGCRASMPTAAQERGVCEACGATATAEELRQQVRFPGLEDADERLAYVYETLLSARAFLAGAKSHESAPDSEVDAAVAGMVARVSAAMHDDLNSAAALAEISEPLATANRLLASAKGVSKAARWKTLHAFVDAMGDVSAMLGMFGDEPEAWLLARRDLKAARVGLDVVRVEQLMAQRVAARVAKDFARADELRAELSALEVKIRDTGDSAQWSL